MAVLTAFSAATDDEIFLSAHRMRETSDTLPSPAVSKHRSKGSRSDFTKPGTPPRLCTACVRERCNGREREVRQVVGGSSMSGCGE